MLFTYPTDSACTFHLLLRASILWGLRLPTSGPGARMGIGSRIYAMHTCICYTRDILQEKGINSCFDLYKIF